MIGKRSTSIRILAAEDDADDRLLIKDALEASGVDYHLRFVQDGDELLDDLRSLETQGAASAPGYPDIILLDLNMPRKGGREALEEIKADEHMRHIPVVVLTTSKSDEDVVRSYETGVAGYISKPVTFSGLVSALGGLVDYWKLMSKSPASEA